MKLHSFWTIGLVLLCMSLLPACATWAAPDMNVSEFVAAGESLVLDPLLASRAFEFDESTLVQGMNETAAMQEIRGFLSTGETVAAVTAAVQLVHRHPLCYPAWTLLSVATLQSADAGGQKILAGDSLSLQKLLKLIVAGFRGDMKTVADMKLSLLREHRDWWPMYKVLPMLSESIVDFRDKAEFNRRCLREASAWQWKSTLEMMAVNGIISALEAEGGCRRVCEESNLNEKGAELLCPLGVKITSGPDGPRCPIHSR